MYEFKVEGLNCMSCVHNIEDTLKEIDSSVLTTADTKKQILKVESKLPREQIIKLIEASGYEVKGA